MTAAPRARRGGWQCAGCEGRTRPSRATPSRQDTLRSRIRIRQSGHRGASPCRPCSPPGCAACCGATLPTASPHWHIPEQAPRGIHARWICRPGLSGCPGLSCARSGLRTPWLSLRCRRGRDISPHSHGCVRRMGSGRGWPQRPSHAPGQSGHHPLPEPSPR